MARLTRLWIVRHGDTFTPGEPSRRIGARTDSPLVASGHAQARALRGRFEADGVRFDRVLCGPLRRTRETAALIVPDVDAERCDWLTEIDHGPDENRTEAEVVARIGAAAIAAWDIDAIAPAGWRVDAERRIAAWRALLAEAAPGQCMLAVTSNGAARYALFAGIGRDAVPGPLKLRTGAWARAELAAGQHWRVIEWDRRP